ncbi:right-handed parallel beta-helix repeat-containing protein [Bacillus solimangrovi]|uniref:Right handed beta helix domain-containing protein n=1 Tax=Bacillus solimangrovi TaxID=1305675 RepID=A0A1E5LAI7_9BACI|nr:right-handed parallel beta-helix repeat-containing protein [Bacillus solimangrovi]OEH91095.1 hypothetical protein BFG57_06915 [Bacillus solimangrovi]
MAIHVVPSDAFPSIQDAVDFASNGDSIQVLAGTFDGFNVPFAKTNLKIFGCGIGKTIIAGLPGMGSTGILIDGNGTILQGFTVQGFSDGINLSSNNSITKQIEVILNRTCGILVGADNNALIEISAIFNEVGFDINSSDNLILRCKAEQNLTEGFCLAGRENCILDNSSKENGGDGFLIDNDEMKVFNNKSIKNNANGINIDLDQNFLITNLICDNSENGIFIQTGAEQNVLDSNIVRNNGNDDTTAGIFVENGATENVIHFNKAKNNIIVDINAQGGIGTNIYDGNKCENSSPPNLCT